MKIAIIGAGQFAGSFATLWQRHPGVDEVWVSDLIPERAERLAERCGLAGTLPDADAVLARDVDAVAVFTQRWLHHPTVVDALRAGKHVYSAVPMGVNEGEIREIAGLVEATGLTYMMGETSYYYPQTVYARRAIAEGAWGRVFYAEGDYCHDMDNGFYAAYQYSGGDDWKRTASYPPMMYPTHGLGGVLGAWSTHLTSVSCLGVVDDGGDGVFDRDVSLWGNDFSNMTALYETADGGVVRHNEFRRVGHPARTQESRYRFYGTRGVLEQGSLGTSVTTSDEVADLTERFLTREPEAGAGAELADVDPALRESFSSGMARVHDRGRLPAEFAGAPNGHEGSHHFLADDFVRAVHARQQPPVNAWLAARLTLPGITAWHSARAGGQRLPIPDLGDCPLPVLVTD